MLAEHGIDKQTGLMAAPMRCRRKLAMRDGRLAVAARRPAVHRAFARASLEVAEESEER